MDGYAPAHGEVCTMHGGEEDERLQHALELAYRYLNSRDRTVAEVRRRLERGNLPSDTVARALRVLSEQHFLDDRRYARLFIEDKRTLEQWGTGRIRRTLLERGLGRDLIEEALAEADQDPAEADQDPAEADQDPGEAEADDRGPEGELGRALALLRRRFPSPPRDRRERDRALRVLLRKGYDSELALDALSSYAETAT
jgi:regulatory protein